MLKWAFALGNRGRREGRKGHTPHKWFWNGNRMSLNFSRNFMWEIPWGGGSQKYRQKATELPDPSVKHLIHKKGAIDKKSH